MHHWKAPLEVYNLYNCDNTVAPPAASLQADIIEGVLQLCEFIDQ